MVTGAPVEIRTVEALLERVQARLGPLDGDPVPLEGGITNRNYRWGDFVVRVPGETQAALGISRKGELAAARLAARLGIGPEVVLDEPLVTRFVEGRVLEAAELRARAGEVHALLDRLHGCGETLPVRWDAYDVVQECAAAAPVPERWAPLLELARREPYDPVPCHNDLLCANFIGTPGGRIVILDWEYAGMGDARFDHANFAMHTGAETPHADQLTLSLLREATWGLVQAASSELPFDYAAYAESHFERLRGGA